MKVLIRIILLQLLLIVVIPSKAQKPLGWRYSYNKIKVAYEGTWKYENDSIVFILRIKCIENLIIHDNKKSIWIFGTYSLFKNNKKIIDSDSLLLHFGKNQYDKKSSDNIDKKIYNIVTHQMPLSGAITKKSNRFRFHEINPKHNNLHDNFRIEVDRLNKKNKYLYWDIWKRDIRPKQYGSHTYSSQNNPRSPKPGDFQIPEKCTLTRISHDPYYEIEVVENY